MLLIPEKTQLTHLVLQVLLVLLVHRVFLLVRVSSHLERSIGKLRSVSQLLC